MQVTRQHLYSNKSLRRNWMLVFLVTNSVLYMIQLALYISLFLSPNSGQPIITGINFIVAAVNFLLPLTLLFTYWVLTTCVFAGFPFLSVKAKRRWSAISQLVMGWSLTRLLWGGLATWAALNNWNELFFVDNAWAFSIIVATTFTVLELAPIAAVLATNLTELLHHSDPPVHPSSEKPSTQALMTNAAALPSGGLGPRQAPRSGSFSMPESHLAAAAAVGIVPRGDHIKHVMLAGYGEYDASGYNSERDMGDAPRPAGAVGRAGESKGTPPPHSHSHLPTHQSHNTDKEEQGMEVPRFRAFTAGGADSDSNASFLSAAGGGGQGAPPHTLWDGGAPGRGSRWSHTPVSRHFS
jgi:hypothetical protein